MNGEENYMATSPEGGSVVDDEMEGLNLDEFYPDGDGNENHSEFGDVGYDPDDGGYPEHGRDEYGESYDEEGSDAGRDENYEQNYEDDVSESGGDGHFLSGQDGHQDEETESVAGSEVGEGDGYADDEQSVDGQSVDGYGSQAEENEDYENASDAGDEAANADNSDSDDDEDGEEEATEEMIEHYKQLLKASAEKARANKIKYLMAMEPSEEETELQNIKDCIKVINEAWDKNEAKLRASEDGFEKIEALEAACKAMMPVPVEFPEEEARKLLEPQFSFDSVKIKNQNKELQESNAKLEETLNKVKAQVATINKSADDIDKLHDQAQRKKAEMKAIEAAGRQKLEAVRKIHDDMEREVLEEEAWVKLQEARLERAVELPRAAADALSVQVLCEQVAMRSMVDRYLEGKEMLRKSLLEIKEGDKRLEELAKEEAALKRKLADDWLGAKSKKVAETEEKLREVVLETQALDQRSHALKTQLSQLQDLIASLDSEINCSPDTQYTSGETQPLFTPQSQAVSSDEVEVRALFEDIQRRVCVVGILGSHERVTAEAVDRLVARVGEIKKISDLVRRKAEVEAGIQRYDDMIASQEKDGAEGFILMKEKYDDLVKSKTAELEKIKENIKTLEAGIRETNEFIRSETPRKEELTRKLNEARKPGGAKVDPAEIKRHEDKLAKLERDAKERDREKAELDKKIKEMQGRVKELENTLRGKEGEAELAAKGTDHEEKKLKREQEKLRELCSQLDAIKLKELKKEETVLLAQEAELKKKKGDVAEKRSALEAKYKLKNELTALKKEVEILLKQKYAAGIETDLFSSSQEEPKDPPPASASSAAVAAGVSSSKAPHAPAPAPIPAVVAEKPAEGARAPMPVASTSGVSVFKHPGAPVPLKQQGTSAKRAAALSASRHGYYAPSDTDDEFAPANVQVRPHYPGRKRKTSPKRLALPKKKK